MTTGPERRDVRHPGDAGTDVEVVEHPSFAQLDFELRALRARLDRRPGEPAIISFFDRGARGGRQVVLVYDPGKRLLKRLLLLGEGTPGASRLEIWRELAAGDLAQLQESVFLERTRTPTHQPEVFLGEIASLIERAEE